MIFLPLLYPIAHQKKLFISDIMLSISGISIWLFKNRGACVVQSVKCPTSAQVMISQLVSSSPASGSVLTAPSLEPASDSVSPSLSAPPLLTLCLSLSTNKQTNKQTNIENSFCLSSYIKFMHWSIFFLLDPLTFTSQLFSSPCSCYNIWIISESDSVYYFVSWPWVVFSLLFYVSCNLLLNDGHHW